MGQIRYDGSAPDFSIGSTTIHGSGGRTTTFNPSGGVSVHNPSSTYGTYTGVTGDGTSYIGTPTMTTTSEGGVFSGHTAPWQIQNQQRGALVPVEEAPSFLGGLTPESKESREMGDQLGGAIAEVLFSPLSLFGGGKKKKSAPKKEVKPKKEAKPKIQKYDPSKYDPDDRSTWHAKDYERHMREVLKDAPQGPDLQAKGSYKPHSAAEWKAWKSKNPGRKVTEFVAERKKDPANYYYGGGPAMTPMADFSIRNRPNLMNDPSAMDMAKNFAMQEGLNYGLDMMFPGGGMAKRGVEAIAPAFLARGGPLYLRPGGGSYLDDRFSWAGSRRDIYDRVNRAMEQAPEERHKDDSYLLSRYGPEGMKPGGGESTWYENVKRMIGEEEAKKLKDKKPAKKAAPKKAAPAPRPDPRAQGGVDWNVGLGNVGGWDLSTSGNYTLMDNAKDPYKVNLNAKRAFDTNRLFGAAPLGGPREASKYADYQGGEYQERMPGERITTDIQRGRKPATNPLQPYLDAGISPEQAEMLMANKVPPPRPMNMGGPVYMNEGGKVPWWKSALTHAWKNDNMMKRAENQRMKARDAQANKKALSEGDIGSFLGSAAKMFFNKGGGVSPSAGMEGPIAGMTPGPLGMSDLIAAGKDKSIAKVSYKKTGGKVAQQVDIAYHNPLQPKPSSGE